MADPGNLLVILSDEHRKDMMTCAGSPVHTPNLDRLAREGTRFVNAYTPSPICVPARASLATGLPVHRTRCWDSAQPYDGSIPGWGHQLLAEGHEVVAIGKLHFHDTNDNNGFSEEFVPMHVAGGVGWVLGLTRNPLPPYDTGPRELAEQTGAGETDYTRYDRNVCALAVDWLAKAPAAGKKPWVLFVSFVSPHYPLIAPEVFYDKYDDDTVGLPHRGDEVPEHPVLAQMYRFYNYADHFDDQSVVRARRGYFGLCSFLDHNVGQLLDALDNHGLAANTRVLYTSDHGEMLGDHGMWTKMFMNESSAGIPMIMRGPGVPRGRRVRTPVSLLDVHPTVLDVTGYDCHDKDRDGISLMEIGVTDDDNRHVISEFHDGGSPCGYTMLRYGRWKYIYYADGYPPQLFDLESDPTEDVDRAGDPSLTAVRKECEARLRDIVDPDAANNQAFADQADRMAELGGREALLNRDGHDFGFTPVPS